MLKQPQYGIEDNTMTTNTTGLMKMLGCGKVTAVKIGTDARAKVQVNKRVLWNVSKVKEYINTVSL